MSNKNLSIIFLAVIAAIILFVVIYMDTQEKVVLRKINEALQSVEVTCVCECAKGEKSNVSEN